MSSELKCLVYPASFTGRSTDIIDEFLENKYDALILKRAALICSPDIDPHPLQIDYIIQEERDNSCTYVGHLTMTSIRRNVSKRYGPKCIAEKFKPFILEPILKDKAAFLEGAPVWLDRCIIVRAQASDDRYWSMPGEYQHLYITGIRRTQRKA